MLAHRRGYYVSSVYVSGVLRKSLSVTPHGYGSSVAMSLGTKVRALRLRKRWTLAELAARASCSVSYLNDIEHDRTVPSLGKLQSIAEALGTIARNLLAGVEPYDGG